MFVLPSHFDLTSLVGKDSRPYGRWVRIRATARDGDGHAAGVTFDWLSADEAESLYTSIQTANPLAEGLELIALNDVERHHAPLSANRAKRGDVVLWKQYSPTGGVGVTRQWNSVTRVGCVESATVHGKVIAFADEQGLYQKAPMSPVFISKLALNVPAFLKALSERAKLSAETSYAFDCRAEALEFAASFLVRPESTRRSQTDGLLEAA